MAEPSDPAKNGPGTPQDGAPRDGAQKDGQKEGAPAAPEGLHDPVLHGGLPGGAEAAPAPAPQPSPKPAPRRAAAQTWDGAEYPVYPKPDWWRLPVAGLRLAGVVTVTLTLFLIFLLVKTAERALPALRPLRHGICGLWARLTAACVGDRSRR